jgi:hypothetical protein
VQVDDGVAASRLIKLMRSKEGVGGGGGHEYFCNGWTATYCLVFTKFDFDVSQNGDQNPKLDVNRCGGGKGGGIAQSFTHSVR